MDGRVKYILGGEHVANTPTEVYDDGVCAFLGALSAEIGASGAARRHPDLAALAFWCRSANVKRLKEAFGDRSNRLGRGLCFHVAPSNIPVNFAFSWLFSLLAGNANIVRLPSAAFPQADIFCEIAGGLLDRRPDIRERTAFVRYPADNAITAEFSLLADARVIWGGDETVATVRALPTKPRCLDVAFADRYSLCLIDGRAALEADNERLRRLAEGFYNDTWLMDQNACSSPNLILWTNDSEEARNRFWDAVWDYAARRYDLRPAVVMDKYVKMCEDAITLGGLESVKRNGNLLYRAELRELPPHAEGLRGVGGYFYECGIESLGELAPLVTDKYQTLTYFGFDEKELRAFVVKNRLRGIDRVAPIGKALDINVFWDGFDLVRTLSRVVA
jgi:hypothetical protein